jgi:hypothetical protein
MILNIITTLLGMLGVYGVFTANVPLIFIGGIAGLLENIIGIISRQQNNLMTATVSVIIGVIVALSSGMTFWYGALAGLSFECTIMGVLGWLGVLVVSRKMD